MRNIWKEFRVNILLYNRRKRKEMLSFDVSWFLGNTKITKATATAAAAATITITIITIIIVI